MSRQDSNVMVCISEAYTIRWRKPQKLSDEILSIWVSEKIVDY